MSIHESSMFLLKAMYDACQEDVLYRASYRIDRDTYRNMPSKERLELDRRIQYLRDSEYIKPHTLCVGLPVSYTLTPADIREIEGIAATKGEPTYAIVFGDNYGVNANKATGNTVANGPSLADITSLITKTVSSKDDQAELLNAISDLFDRIEKGYPIEQGLLAKSKGTLEKYQTILAAIIPKVIDYLVSPK